MRFLRRFGETFQVPAQLGGVRAFGRGGETRGEGRARRGEILAMLAEELTEELVCIGEELAGIGEGIGGGVPMMGCLTFGEVGAPESGMPQFHNKTAVVFAMAR